MNKKLMAVAVAGAFVVPGLALAQSSVTISGYVKVGPDNIRYSGATNIVGGTTRTGSSETRITDHSSRIIFNVTEDLGGGLQAIMQMDTRFNPSDVAQPNSQGYAAAVGGGNTWVGLRSKSWGTLTFGRHDLHYGKAGDDTAAKAGSLLLIADSIMGNAMSPQHAAGAAGNTAAVGRNIAGQTRTNNVVRWDSPQWGIFSGTIAYSTNPLQVGGGGSNTEGDLHTSATGLAGSGVNTGTTIRRKGSGWNLNPKLTGSNWFVEWSHWRAKSDLNNAGSITFAPANTNFNPAAAAGGVTTQAIVHDQRSDTLAGNMRFGGFKVGAAWNRQRHTDPASGLVSADRTAWSIPLSYTWGPHSVAGHYTRARDSKSTSTAAAGAAAITQRTGADTGAHMWAVAYDYSLSKRTHIGLSYGQLRNKANATYNFFYNTQTAFGSNGTAALAGEDIRLFSGAIRHNF